MASRALLWGGIVASGLGVLLGMRGALFVLGFLVVGSVASVARAQAAPRMTDICAAAQRRASRLPESARVFAAIAAPEAPGLDDSVPHDGVWRSVADRAALQSWVDRVAERASVASYQQALVWDLPGNSLIVRWAATSSSGDWLHSVDYCFRADGTLASSRSELATFLAEQGGVRRVRERRFSRLGQPLLSTTRVSDLKDGTILTQPSFMDQDEPLFMTRTALPFAKLF